jgi:hypothetical protein
MPILWALADPKIGEREVLTAMLDAEPQLAAARPGLALITDKGFAGRETEADLAARGITLLRPSRKDEATRHSKPLLKAIRQLIESVNDTLKGQLGEVLDCAGLAGCPSGVVASGQRQR